MVSIFLYLLGDTTGAFDSAEHFINIVGFVGEKTCSTALHSHTASDQRTELIL